MATQGYLRKFLTLFLFQNALNFGPNQKSFLRAILIFVKVFCNTIFKKTQRTTKTINKPPKQVNDYLFLAPL